MRVRFCEGGTLRCPGKDFQVGLIYLIGSPYLLF
jgi:hypothetical protein